MYALLKIVEEDLQNILVFISIISLVILSLFAIADDD